MGGEFYQFMAACCLCKRSGALSRILQLFPYIEALPLDNVALQLFVVFGIFNARRAFKTYLINAKSNRFWFRWKFQWQSKLKFHNHGIRWNHRNAFQNYANSVGLIQID